MSERGRSRHKTKRWKYDAYGSKIKGRPTSPQLPQHAESIFLEMKDWSPASPLRKYFTYIVWLKFWLLLFQRTTKNSYTSSSLPCLFRERLPASFHFFIGPCFCQAWDNIPRGSSPSAVVGGRTVAAFPENQRTFIYIWNKRGKNTIISLSVMSQSIHPLTIPAKMSFDRNSLQR